MADTMKPKRGPLSFVLDDDPTIHHLVKSCFYRHRPDVVVRGFVRLQDMLCAEDLLMVDLFVIDVNLAPGLSGFDVPDLLPATCRKAAFLFVSGFGVDLEDYNRVRFLPLFDFLSKPLRAVQFMHRVDLLLSARFAFPAGIDDRLFSMLSAAPFLALVVDNNDRIKFYNQTAADFLDLESTPAAGKKTLIDIIPGYKAVLGAGQMEFTAETSGHARPLHWLRSPFLDMDDDQYSLLIGIPEEARRRKADRLRELYQEIIIRDRSAIRSIKSKKPAPCAGRPAA
jgi:hypothetical protein